MKKTLLVVTLLASFGVVFAAEADGVKPAEGATCEYDSAEELVEKWSANQVGGVPDCPADDNDCTPNGNFCFSGSLCGIDGSFDAVDTGLSKCRKSSGLLNCKSGETVYVTTAPCSQCPCCETTCFCGPCSQFVRVTCGPFSGGTGSE